MFKQYAVHEKENKFENKKKYFQYKNETLKSTSVQLSWNIKCKEKNVKLTSVKESAKPSNELALSGKLNS